MNGPPTKAKVELFLKALSEVCAVHGLGLLGSDLYIAPNPEVLTRVEVAFDPLAPYWYPPVQEAGSPEDIARWEREQKRFQP